MRIKITFFLCTSVSLHLFAQNTSSSPFSSIGLGERESADHAVFSGIGTCNTTYFDSTILNYFNPASYNTLATGQPLFSLGLTSRISQYSQNGLSKTNATAFVEHFVMGFRVKKNVGFAFGLKPFSRRGYELSERIAVGGDSMLNTYIGSGGIHQVFLGLSTNLIKFKQTKLAVGGNLSYLFGETTNERRSQLIEANSKASGIDWNSIRFNSFYYELGAYFKQSFGKNHNLLIGATASPAQKTNASQNYSLFYGAAGNPENYDTLLHTQTKGSLNIPLSFSVGLNYNWWFNTQKRNNSFRNSELSFHINYSETTWSNFTGTFDQLTPGLNTRKIAAGIQFTPERKFLESAVNSGVFSTMKYRLGCYQYTLPYVYDGSQLHDRGITAGIGIPVLAQQALSSVNIGLTYGTRSGKLPTSLNENYLGISLGLILAPSFYERWFKKRKLD